MISRRHSTFIVGYSLFVIILVHGSYSQTKYQTLGGGGCGLGQTNCHVSESKNMVDKHKNSPDDLAGSDDAKKYAELSGVGEANMLKGNSKCMECHGTVVSGKETKEVEEGVSCESCHGPGSGYKDPHSEGPKGGPGIVREGYTKSLALGLKVLKDYNVRAVACVRCHLTTDQKILASGHPSGLKFNYKSGMKSVAKHWKRPLSDEDQNLKPFQDAVKARGPVANVPLVKPAKAVAQKEEGEAAPTAEPAAAPARRPPPVPRTPPPDPTTRPVTVGPIELPPFPIITDSTRIDQALILLKKRLELLYKKTGN